MKLLRDALALASVLLLAVGYAASQYYALTGRAPEYVSLIDKTPIGVVSLLLLVAAFIFAFIPEREVDSK